MQLHLYLPDDVAEEVRKRAESKGMPVSRYLADLVRREIRTGWPEGYFESVVGRWQGDLERPSQGPIERRDPL